MPVIAVTDATFEAEVLRSELPVLVDLHADWCGPCKQIAPIVAGLADEFAGKLKVTSVDIDHNPGIAQAFRVSSVPMLVVIDKGELVGHQVGAVDKKAMLEMLAPVLPKNTSQVAPKDLAQLIATGRVVPVDIRDAGSYGRYRIPSAVSVPADELEARMAELVPSDGRLRVLYARSTEPAKERAEALSAAGVQVGFLEGGFLHWEADGLDVDTE